MSEKKLIVLSTKDQPWTKQEDAQTALEKRDDLLKANFCVIPKDGGYVIADVMALAQQAMNPPAASAPAARGAAAEEEYYVLIFQDKGNPNDPEKVALQVNGEILQFTRGVETIVPRSFREAADHAVYRKFTIVPGKPRKTGTPIRRFPYSVVRKSNRLEFLKLYKEGNAIQQKRIDSARDDRD